MRSLIKLGGFTLVAMVLAVAAPSAQAAKKATTEDQVAVLLKWYHTYVEEGKYKQAEQVAELAYEMAPDDPQIVAALKLARRLQNNTVSSNQAQVQAQLQRVLMKLDRVERQLREAEAQRRQRARIQIAKEPPGSPDSNY